MKNNIYLVWIRMQSHFRFFAMINFHIGLGKNLQQVYILNCVYYILR